MKSETQNNNVVNISDAKKFNVATKCLTTAAISTR